jgi:hypothetical protein
VYAICRFPVGLGLGIPDGPGRQAWLRARRPARHAARWQAVARGLCSPPRDSSLEHIVRYVDTAPAYDCVVPVVLEVPYRPDNPFPGTRQPTDRPEPSSGREPTPARSGWADLAAVLKESAVVREPGAQCLVPAVGARRHPSP